MADNSAVILEPNHPTETIVLSLRLPVLIEANWTSRTREHRFNRLRAEDLARSRIVERASQLYQINRGGKPTAMRFKDFDWPNVSLSRNKFTPPLLSVDRMAPVIDDLIIHRLPFSNSHVGDSKRC